MPPGITRQSSEDIAEVFYKAHVKEPVRFIDDQDAHIFGVEDLLLHVVNKTARCGDHNVRASAKGLFLFDVVNTAKDGEHLKIGMISQKLGLFADLDG